MTAAVKRSGIERTEDGDLVQTESVEFENEVESLGRDLHSWPSETTDDDGDTSKVITWSLVNLIDGHNMSLL